MSKYFGRPRFPWFFTFVLGFVVLAVPLLALWVITLSSFRPSAVLDAWCDWCLDRAGYPK